MISGRAEWGVLLAMDNEGDEVAAGLGLERR
jgi:hypothetical protein